MKFQYFSSWAGTFISLIFIPIFLSSFQSVPISKTNFFFVNSNSKFLRWKSLDGVTCVEFILCEHISYHFFETTQFVHFVPSITPSAYPSNTKSKRHNHNYPMMLRLRKKPWSGLYLLLQCPSLHGITLDQHKSDNNNRMIHVYRSYVAGPAYLITRSDWF